VVPQPLQDPPGVLRERHRSPGRIVQRADRLSQSVHMYFRKASRTTSVCKCA
jgi:hypothetical protein